MSDVFLLYLFTRLDDLKDVLGLISVLGTALGLLGVVFTTIFMTGSGPDSKFPDQDTHRLTKTMQPKFRLALIAGLCAIAFNMLVPTKTNTAIIVGGKLALDAAQSETGKEIAGEVVQAIRKQLKEAGK